MVTNLLSDAQVSLFPDKLFPGAEQRVQRALESKELSIGSRRADQRVDTFLAGILYDKMFQKINVL